jgi:UDP-glucose 4-epimerase
LQNGWRVLGIDCLNDAYPPVLKWHNLAPLLANPRFHFLNADVSQIANVRVLPAPQYVFHLAARAGVRTSFGANTPAYIADNVVATMALLEQSRAWNVRTFVYASSSSIYGDCGGRAVPEDTRPSPASPYAVTKLAAEMLCRQAFERHGLPAVCIRFFTVYGPAQRPDMAVHRFVSALQEDRDVMVYGDGRQTRDLTYVSDVVDALLASALQGTPGAAYNVAGGAPVTVLDLLRMIEDIAGVRARLRFIPRQEGDVGHTHGDIRRACRELGYTPRIGLRQGLQMQVNWQMSRPSGEELRPNTMVGGKKEGHEWDIANTGEKLRPNTMVGGTKR